MYLEQIKMYNIEHHFLLNIYVISNTIIEFLNLTTCGNFTL